MTRTSGSGRRVVRGARRGAVAAGLVAGLAVPALAVLPAHAETTTVVVSGLVRDAATVEGLPGVCVMDVQSCASGELTAADGTFRRTVVLADDADSIELTVVPQKDDPFHAPMTITATRSASWKVTVDLPALAAVTGRVLSWSTVEPVKGMCASIVGQVNASPTQCTDDDGVYTLTRVTSAAAALIKLVGEGYQDSFVPGGSKPATAQRFSLPENRLTTLPDTYVREEATVVQPGGSGWARLVAVKVGSGGSDLVPPRLDREWTSWPDDAPQWSVEPGKYKLGFYAGNEDECDSDDDNPAVCPDDIVVWYPGTVDPGKARTVQLKTGTTFSWAPPVAPFRKSLAIKLSGLPLNGPVQARFFFASGAEFRQSFDYVARASSTGTATLKADYLPTASLKVQLVVTMPDGTTRSLWYGGKKLADAKLLPPSASSISVQVPGQ